MLISAFKNYQLTNGQLKLVELLNDFIANNDFCFILKGYAGTGKTFMMQGLTDYLTSIKHPFAIAAPTGRAAKVISQKTKKPAYTIHRTVYSNTDLREYKVKNEDGTETFKFFYNLRDNEDSINTIYIIDEASMISNQYSEGEFFRFGSGFLLNDLIKYINFGIAPEQIRRKIIFIGDNAQLPPVNSNFSPALNADYLKKKLGFPVKEFELTEVVRQKQNSGILYNATQIRNSLKQNIFNQIDITTNFHDVIPVEYQNLMKTYVQVCGNKISEKTIIVAHTNNSVKDYNELVRNHFFPNQKYISNGDRIIVVSNNYNYPIELLNGDFGTVVSVNKMPEIRNIPLKRKKPNGKVTENKVSLTFRNVTIRFVDVEGKVHDITCKIIENLLYSSQRDLSSDETRALYIDFKIRNRELKAGTPEFKKAIKNDPYFNALRVKFGYAVTCHKGQGGEWKNAFVDLKTSMGYFNSSYFRWAYTAITRAKEALYVLNEPHFPLGAGLKSVTQINYIQREDLIVLPPDILENDISFSIPNENPYLQNIFYAVFELLKDEAINIDNIVHHQYCEQYHFTKGDEKAVLLIYYNKKAIISNIQVSTHNEFANQLYGILKSLIKKTIIIETTATEINETNEAEIVTDFPDDKPFLKLFYERVKAKASAENIRVKNVTHYNYHEKYEFMKGVHQVVVNVYYNSQGRFTRIVPNEKLSTSAELLQKVIDLLNF